MKNGLIAALLFFVLFSCEEDTGILNQPEYLFPTGTLSLYTMQSSSLQKGTFLTGSTLPIDELIVLSADSTFYKWIIDRKTSTRTLRSGAYTTRFNSNGSSIVLNFSDAPLWAGNCLGLTQELVYTNAGATSTLPWCNGLQLSYQWR